MAGSNTAKKKNTTTRQNSAGTKKTNTRKTASRKNMKASSTAKSTRSRSSHSGKEIQAVRPASGGKQSISSGFQREILMLVLCAAAIILIVSCLGMGGSVGAAISTVMMGTMGKMAYVFPFLFLAMTLFLISNKGNVLAYKKTAAAVVLFLVICGVVQLVTEGYTVNTTLEEYYKMSAEYHTGGGAIGGAICISMISAFGTVGAYVIIVLAILVCLILITQHSFLGFLYKLYDRIADFFRGTRTRYEEGAPERELKKQLKEQKKRIAAEERRAKKLQELETALAEGDERETAPAYEKKAVPRSRRNRMADPENTSGGFLAGTDLFHDNDGQKLETEEEDEAEGAQMQFATREPDFAEKMEDAEDGEDMGVEDAAQEETDIDSEETEDPEYLKQLDQLYRTDSDMNDEDIHIGTEIPDFRAVTSASAADTSLEAGETDYEEEDCETGIYEPVCEEYEEMPQDVPVPSVPEEKAVRQPAKNPKSSQKEIESGIRNIQHEINTQEELIKKEYQFPPLKLLKWGDNKKQKNSVAALQKTAQKLQEILYNFGVNATVTNYSCGPTVTRYELQPEMGVKVSKIVGLTDDIKLNLAAADIRMEAPIPGKAAVGIEVPNKETTPVMLRELLQSPEFQNAKSKLSFAVGKDIEGKTVVADIAKMPHLLIAGSTGSGKSVCINTLIISILYKAKPDEVKLIMIDPKVVELSVYNGIPHLFIPVVTDPKKAAGALNWAVTEMSNRYNTFAEYGVRNIGEFNKKIQKMSFPEDSAERPEKMCHIVIIVDELADLMMVAPGDVEDAICRLAQLARAAGIHLVIATQRPSVNVITGLIKANMPSRIAFAVTSGVDSRTILDMNGAEKLLGKGDMLFYPQGYQKPARLQGAFVSDDEVSSVVEFLADKNPRTDYNNKIEQQMNNSILTAGGASGGNERDVYFEQAGKFIIEKEKASIGMLQRMYKIGFNRAARIMDQLCDAGVVGPEEGTKPRKVLMTLDEFQTYVEEHL